MMYGCGTERAKFGVPTDKGAPDKQSIRTRRGEIAKPKVKKRLPTWVSVVVILAVVVILVAVLTTRLSRPRQIKYTKENLAELQRYIDADGRLAKIEIPRGHGKVEGDYSIFTLPVLLGGVFQYVRRNNA